jgi:hypothetical protein
MKKNGALFLTAILAGFPAPGLYAGAGSDGAAFLKIEAGARAAGMGGAFTAVADDASSVFYNPAGPALVRSKEIMLAHNEWLAGLRNEHAAYVHPVSSRLTLFTGVTALIIPSLAKYDSMGNNTGSFSAMDGAAGAGFAWAAREDVLLGLFAKTVFQRADKESASSFAGDLGVISDAGNDVRLGAAIQNLGAPMRLYKENFALPVTYRGGGAYRLKDMLWLTAEAIKAGQSDAALAVGAEGQATSIHGETVFGRLGYKSGRSKNAGPGISAGVGFRSGNFQVDYAFSPFGDLGNTHRVSVTARFGEDREDLPGETRGIKRARVGDRPAMRVKTRKSQEKGKKSSPSKKDGAPDYFMW